MGNENLTYGAGTKYLEHQSKDNSTISAEAIAENMFQAIDTIVSKRLENLPYNTTKICMVIDDTHKDLGIYRVTDNTATFIAYSDSTEYKVDDRVRVSIENNDTTQKKYIIGKYSSNDINSLITATSPLDEIVIINPGIFTYTGYSKALTANNKYQFEETLGYTQGKFNETQICNTLYIKANFQSNLGNYDVRSGDYGIRLLIANDRGETREATLSTKDMLGDPYTLLTPTTQSAIFDISDFGVITDIRGWFYQNNNFSYWNGEEVQLFGEEDINLNIKNLFVSDIEVGLAIGNLSEIADNTLQLYTTGSLEYSGANTNTADNLRDISLIWYNKSGSNSYLGFSDGIHDLSYDEFDYLAKLDEYNELKAETAKDVPNDLIGLQLSRNTSKILLLMEEIIDDYFDRNGYLDDIFEKFEVHPDMEVFFNDDVNDEFFKQFDTLRLEYIGPLNTIKNNASEYYTAMLKEAKYLQDYGKYNYEHISKYLNESVSENSYLKLNETLQNKINEFIGNDEKGLTYLLKELEKKVGTTAYKSTTTEFINSINDILNNLKSLLQQIHDYYNYYYNQEKGYALDAALKDFFAKDEDGFLTYHFNEFEADFPYEDYENRYAIYWYKYDSDYTNNTQFEKNFLRKQGLNWRRLEIDSNKGLPHDVGKMEKISKDKIVYYYPTLPTQEEATLYNQSLAINKKKEKFLVLLFYNHDVFYSNILEFHNKYYINEDVDLSDQAVVSIENGQGSRDMYSVYDENNMLISDTDRTKKHLILNYMGVDGSGYEKLSGAKVAWYIPSLETPSQLTYDLDDLEKLGFGSDVGDTVSATTNSIDGYTCFSKTLPTLSENPTEEEIEAFQESLLFAYKIKTTYDNTNNNNTVICRVIINGYTYQPRKSFGFASYGNNGTDYTFALTKVNEQELLAEAVSDGVDNALILKVSLLSPTGENIKVHYNSVASIMSGEVYASGLKNYDIIPYDRNATDTGLISPYIIKFYNKNGDDLSVLSGTYEEDTDVVETIKIIKPIAKDFEEGGLLAGSNSEDIIFEDDRYCGVLQLKMNLRIPGTNVSTNEETSVNYELVELDYTYPITYLKDRAKYSMVGANNIIYNSYGTNPSYDKIEYNLSSNDKNEIIDVIWQVVAYPKRNIEKPEIDFSKLTYKPYLEGSTLIVPNLYSESEYVYMVQCLGKPKAEEVPPSDPEDTKLPLEDENTTPKENDYTIVLGVRPLNIIQNNYAISTINNWNGRGVSINEGDTGSVLSTIVAAGAKTVDNKFSGVVLGNLRENTNDQTLETPGLYGFHEGEQTFGFRNNGTGFIGNNAGRIEFDGTGKNGRGRIYSANGAMEISLGDSTICMNEIEEDKNRRIVISAATGTTYPLSIGQENEDGSFNGFRVDWGGTITANTSLNISGSTVEGLTVTSGMIGQSAVGSDALAADSVLTTKIINNAVTTNKLADGAVTTDKIVDKAVVASKIADKTITKEQIADNTINSDKIENGSIKTDDLANKSITTAKLADDAIIIELLPNIPINKIIIEKENGDTTLLSDLLTSYENRIKSLEDKLAEEAFIISVEEILRSHNLIAAENNT